MPRLTAMPGLRGTGIGDHEIVVLALWAAPDEERSISLVGGPGRDDLHQTGLAARAGGEGLFCVHFSETLVPFQRYAESWVSCKGRQFLP